MLIDKSIAIFISQQLQSLYRCIAEVTDWIDEDTKSLSANS